MGILCARAEHAKHRTSKRRMRNRRALHAPRDLLQENANRKADGFSCALMLYHC